jgi:hypothetical protein
MALGSILFERTADNYFSAKIPAYIERGFIAYPAGILKRQLLP